MFKKIFLILFVLLLTLINTKVYLHEGVPYTHDGDAHLARFANYKIAIRQLQIPPRFGPNLVNNYGYPVFNFNYPLANILSVPFTAIGLHYELTYKILMSFTIGFGILGIILWLKKLKASDKAALFGGAVYALSPYLTNLVYIRGNTGEIMAFGLLPWLFYIIENLNHESRIMNQEDTNNKIQLLLSNSAYLANYKSIFFILLITAFMLSHNVTVLFGVPLMILYTITRFGKNIKKWIKYSCFMILASCLSLWFWLPALVEKSQVILDNIDTQKDYYQHFATVDQLLFSPIKFGYSFYSNIDSLSYQLGLTQVLGLLISIILLISYFMNHESRIKNYKKNSVLIFTTVISTLLILFQLSITTPLWKILPLINYIQFPWRLQLFSSVFLAISAGLVFEYLNKSKIKTLLLVVLIWQAIGIYRSKPLEYVRRDKIEYELYSQSTQTSHENTPKTFTYKDFHDWQPHPVILDGQAEYQVTHWTGSDKKYTINVSEISTIVEPTMYFSGWTTWANGEKVAYVDDEIVQGRIAFEMEPGTYEIESKFTQWTRSRIVGNGIGIITAISLLGWLIYDKIRH